MFLPWAAGRYVLEMDPRRASLPLALMAGVAGFLMFMLGGASLVLVVGELVRIPQVVEAIAGIGLGTGGGIYLFERTRRRLRRTPASIQLRALLLVPMGCVAPLAAAAAAIAAGMLVWPELLLPALGLIGVLAIVWLPGFYLCAERRIPEHLGHCLHCGYDLAGLTSGICPECGRAALPTAGDL
jgi:hypothetical protein